MYHENELFCGNPSFPVTIEQEYINEDLPDDICCSLYLDSGHNSVCSGARTRLFPEPHFTEKLCSLLCVAAGNRKCRTCQMVMQARTYNWKSALRDKDRNVLFLNFAM